MILDDFKKNVRGNVAVTFALMGVPIAVVTTLALDSYASRDMEVKLQSALDSAVLATVSNGTLPEGEREAYARARFASNFPGEAVVTFADDRSTVQMSAQYKYRTKLGGIIDKETITIFADSAGMLSQGRTVCVLSLAETGSGTVTFEGSTAFEARNCGVQVNSKDPSALVNRSTMIPRAESFCVNGGATGTFEPAVNSQCDAVKDPYANLVFPVPESCDAVTTKLSDKVISDDTTVNELPGVDIIGTGAILAPGTYCKELSIDGIDVTFLPGTYHLLKGAKFKNTSQAIARNVTFVLHGSKAEIKIEKGAEVYIKAPFDGPLAGLAIAQGAIEYKASGKKDDPNTGLTSKVSDDSDKDDKKAKTKIPTSYLRSSGALDVVGTVYLPDQHLEVSGDSRFGARSQSTSFIAYSVEFTGSTHTNIAVDHQAEGLPPIEPRVETSPRLIR